MAQDIIAKLKESKLLGRSGSGFPTGFKWEMVKNEKAVKKYIVCNAASGEPKVMKDEYLLENHAQEVVEGIKIALETFENSEAFIYLRKDFYAKFKDNLTELTKGLPITLIKKQGGYLAGEETCLCEAIEEKTPEPRIKPPFPTQAGLFGRPTLINNAETFYHISQIAQNKYKNTRFYTIGGQVKKKGVFEMPADWPIERVLKETGNWPKFDFFAQVGGGASGEILLPDELQKPAGGTGAIIIYEKKKTQCLKLMKEWAQFFLEQNCDKCTPCREGVFRINEMLGKGKIDEKTLQDIVNNLKEASFCGLGKIAGIPFSRFANKICKSLLTEKK
ncbi:MAG: NADH-ubiquinone oxidoreductase-F iron-sulfur binding region domain-containing protein [Candidatus Nealsonbacteria bacterium]